MGSKKIYSHHGLSRFYRLLWLAEQQEDHTAVRLAYLSAILENRFLGNQTNWVIRETVAAILF